MLSQSTNSTTQTDVSDTVLRQVAIILGHERLHSKYNEFLERLSSIIKLVYDQQPERFLMTNTFLNAINAIEREQDIKINAAINADTKKTGTHEKTVRGALENNKAALKAHELLTLIRLNELVRAHLKANGYKDILDCYPIVDANGQPIKYRYILRCLSCANDIKPDTMDGDSWSSEKLAASYQIILTNIKNYLEKLKQQGEFTTHFSFSDKDTPLKNIINFLFQADNLFLSRADGSLSIGEGNRAFIGVYAGLVLDHYKPVKLFPQLKDLDQALTDLFSPEQGPEEKKQEAASAISAKSSSAKQGWRKSLMFGFGSAPESVKSPAQKQQFLREIIDQSTAKDRKLTEAFNTVFNMPENGPQLIQHYINHLLNQIYPQIGGLAQLRMAIKQCLVITRHKKENNDSNNDETDVPASPNNSHRSSGLARTDSLHNHSLRNVLDASLESPRSVDTDSLSSPGRKLSKRVRRTDSLLSPRLQSLSLESSPRDEETTSLWLDSKDKSNRLFISDPTETTLFAETARGSRNTRRITFTVKPESQSELPVNLEVYLETIKKLKLLVDKLKKMLELRSSAKEKIKNDQETCDKNNVKESAPRVPRLNLGRTNNGKEDKDVEHLLKLCELTSLLEDTMSHLSASLNQMLIRKQSKEI